MLSKKIHNIFFVSMFLCVGTLCSAGNAKEFKEFTTPHFSYRDPFAWLPEKKREATVLAKKAEKKVGEKKHEMPWTVCGVSLSSEGEYALFSHRHETKIVRSQQEVCRGWKVAKITPTAVQLKHTSGEYKELFV